MGTDFRVGVILSDFSREGSRAQYRRTWQCTRDASGL